MAESAVTFLIERLATLAAEEIRLLRGVAREIKSIKEEFQSIKILLREADARVDLDDGVKEWVKQVRGVAYEIEDVLDEYFLSRHQIHQRPESRIESINNIFQKIRGFFKCLKSHHEIGNQIIDIKERIETITRRKERNDLANLKGASSSTAATLSQHDPRHNALSLEETDLVGIDGPRDKLIGYIREANLNLVVVSVLGEGGLGKTTIVKKVYDRMEYAFKYRAWLAMSETPDTKALLANLLKQLLPEHKAGDSIIELKQQLYNNLRGKRYIVVLDDVWTVSAWKHFKNALPDDNKSGSRILVTTRKQEVADTCIDDYGYMYPLKRLDPDQSWKLIYMKLCKSRFVDVSAYPNGELMTQSKKFLKKCNGLPLAIVAIGGLLSTKRPNEWDQEYRRLGSLMDQPSSSPLGDLHMIISLSFNDLPYHLKSCFLYMSMFPEDYTIHCSKLLRLWVAQGFVVTEQGKYLLTEEIARSYLDELIQRSLIQVEDSYARKKVMRCKMLGFPDKPHSRSPEH